VVCAMGINPRRAWLCACRAPRSTLTPDRRTPSLADSSRAGAELARFPKVAPARAVLNPMADLFSRVLLSACLLFSPLGLHGPAQPIRSKLIACEAATSPCLERPGPPPLGGGGSADQPRRGAGFTRREAARCSRQLRLILCDGAPTNNTVFFTGGARTFSPFVVAGGRSQSWPDAKVRPTCYGTGQFS